MSYIIDQEQEDFINNSDIELSEIVNPASIKSNFHIVQTNNNNLNVWLIKLRNYVRYIRNLIDVQIISELVLSNISKNKTILHIPYIMDIGQILNQESNGIIYQITRISTTKIEITNYTTPIWENFNLIVQIKNEDGDIVRPVITTKNNKISLEFQDQILTNYYVILI